jgi:hypothetical protein
MQLHKRMSTWLQVTQFLTSSVLNLLRENYFYLNRAETEIQIHTPPPQPQKGREK